MITNYNVIVLGVQGYSVVAIRIKTKRVRSENATITGDLFSECQDGNPREGRALI